MECATCGTWGWPVPAIQADPTFSLKKGRKEMLSPGEFRALYGPDAIPGSLLYKGSSIDILNVRHEVAGVSWYNSMVPAYEVRGRWSDIIVPLANGELIDLIPTSSESVNLWFPKYSLRVDGFDPPAVCAECGGNRPARPLSPAAWDSEAWSVALLEGTSHILMRPSIAMKIFEVFPELLDEKLASINAIGTVLEPLQ